MDEVLLVNQTVQTAAMVSLVAEAVGEVLILQDITLDMVALVYLVRQVAVVVVVQDRITLEQQAVDGLTIFPQMGEAVELMVDKLLHMALAVVLVVVTLEEEVAHMVVVELVDEAVMAVHQAQEGAVVVPLILELVVHQAQAVEVK